MTEKRTVLDNIRTKQITRRLPCALSDEERLAFADQLADAHIDIENAKNVLKTQQKELQRDVMEAQARQEKLNGIVATKTEYRDIDVEITNNYETGRVTHVRMDTGEIIVDRRMTQDEKQQSLLDDGVIFSEEDGQK